LIQDWLGSAVVSSRQGRQPRTPKGISNVRASNYEIVKKVTTPGQNCLGERVDCGIGFREVDFEKAPRTFAEKYV